ncbi:glycine cleavage system aminomethyltransferase GcvT [Ornithinibacillus sp. L9]|uniref:Aminomethyltransferase n=1 Tax=Ornithinibacillus caprae TaxID=2678566 RepID=A0A6N8FFV8_9BACI|nr:glycine cleavage system aminomethyltransferase GcvT [Ornithinibacillus caprae]MUK87144.1 glycine cleavage system aminomethyltransferase GcvT [Ornithinibacillus caprae]
MSELKRTPLYPVYEKYGAKTIDFGGWDLPVQFSSIKHEHEVTRTKAGLFDVSHMGEIVVKGPESLAFLQKVVTNDVSKLTPKKAQYSLMCYENGGTVDDFLIYMLEEDHYLLVVNAANTDKDYEWLVEQNTYSEQELTIINVSSDYVQLALQGPLAEEILQTITETDLSQIKFFRFEENVHFTNIPSGALVSRTGYTGEDGFEIYIDPASGCDLWDLLLEVGKDKGLEPIGLGARDTLRFEASLPLYGQELSKDITPIEAGLKFAVKMDKAVDFIGKERLKEQLENGPARKIVGIEMIDKGIPRHGYEVTHDGQVVGFVTSGTQSPTLNKNIGLVLVNANVTEIGTELSVQVRKRTLRAKVIPKSFLKHN